MKKYVAYFAAIVGAVAVWNAAPAGASPVVAQAAPAASPSPSPSPSPNALQVSGYADAGYTSASIASAVGTQGGSQITGRVFDTLNQQIQFHNFNVQAAYNGPIGGKVEASFGDDANVINSYPKNTFAAGTDIDITQAYISFISGQFTLIAGKFETLAGAEVIESPSNMNFSRSILFGYAVPFTHTGARLTWAYNSNVSVIAGVNRGWDTTTPYRNNTFAYSDTGALTGEFGIAWNPSKAIGGTVQVYDGNVEEGSSVAAGNPFVVTPGRPTRSLLDTVITYHASPSTTVVVNADFGRQSNSAIFGNINQGLIGYGTGTWNGVAGYVNYAISGQYSATVRAEYLADIGGTRTGINQRWGEVTGTLQYAPNSNIIVRGEIRGDRSNQPFFIGQNGYIGRQNAQFGLETIVKWP